MNIALVDDDPVNNYLNRRILELAVGSIAFREFANGLACYEALTREHYAPDLVLLDLNMPVWSGWDLLKHLQEAKLTVPIVVLTSSVNPEERRLALSFANVHDFWVKPLNKDFVARWFEEHSA